jgi:hypothetical protein
MVAAVDPQAITTPTHNTGLIRAEITVMAPRCGGNEEEGRMHPALALGTAA